jgi:hypothetical protein
VGSKTYFSHPAFLASIREYLPMDAVIRETDARGNPGANALYGELAENTFYIFDADAMCAVGHAIEDLALEEGNGRVLSAFQDFANFETHRERYCQLAATVDGVQALAAGRKPRAARRIQFIRDTQSAGKAFWMVSYEGHHRHALLLCRQMNRAEYFEDGIYTGFYTFDAPLVARFRKDMAESAKGGGSGLREFGRLQALDHAAKQIQQEFAREKETLSAAFRKLMRSGGEYHAESFAADLDKGLSRLLQWKTRLPEMLARAESH